MVRHRRIFAFGIGISAVTAFVACGSSNTPTNTGGSTATCNGSAAVSGLGTPAVTIDATDDLLFVPASASAHVGDVVEFKNTGSVAHTVTFQGSDDGCLTDDTLAPAATWDVKFTVAGTYDYICTVHAPKMKGEITVSG